MLPDLGFEDEPVEEVKIAVTTFAYNNGEVIKLLEELLLHQFELGLL